MKVIVDLTRLSPSNRLAFVKAWNEKGLYIDDCKAGNDCVFCCPWDFGFRVFVSVPRRFSIADLVSAYWEQYAKLEIAVCNDDFNAWLDVMINVMEGKLGKKSVILARELFEVQECGEDTFNDYIESVKASKEDMLRLIYLYELENNIEDYENIPLPKIINELDKNASGDWLSVSEFRKGLKES